MAKEREVRLPEIGETVQYLEQNRPDNPFAAVVVGHYDRDGLQLAIIHRGGGEMSSRRLVYHTDCQLYREFPERAVRNGGWRHIPRRTIAINKDVVESPTETLYSMVKTHFDVGHDVDAIWKKLRVKGVKKDDVQLIVDRLEQKQEPAEV